MKAPNLSSMASNLGVPPAEEQGAYRNLEWDDASVARFWRWQAQRPQEYFTNLFGDRIARALEPILRGGDGTVLDYGCGPGFLPRHLAALGCRVWAMDFSPESVAITNERNKYVPGFYGATDLSEIGQFGQRFSRIVSVETIEHLDEQHIGSFFEAINYLLAPGGILVITTPNQEKLATSEMYCPCCDHVFHRYQHVRTFSADTLSAMVGSNGLVPVRTYSTDFSRRPWWHPRQIAQDMLTIIRGEPPPRPHLVCIASKPA